jgi:type III secretion system FlhB-like substrate exporter
MHEENKRVVGLQYRPEEGLPRVILKGGGRLASEIMRRRDALRGPPVVRNEQLVKALYRLPVDGEIGPELFELVAILLVHVFAVEESEERRESWLTHSTSPRSE